MANLKNRAACLLCDVADCYNNRIFIIPLTNSQFLKEILKEILKKSVKVCRWYNIGV